MFRERPSRSFHCWSPWALAPRRRDSYLQERFSSPVAYLILCGAYLVAALVIYMVVRARERRSAEIADAELAQMPIVSPVTAAMDQLHIQRTLLDLAGDWDRRQPRRWWNRPRKTFIC